MSPIRKRCEKCGRAMRLKTESAKAMPQFAAAGAQGLCATCYARVYVPGGRLRREVEVSLSVDEQTVLYGVLLRFRGVEQEQICSQLGLAL